jgi:hypothetical protein
MWSDPASPVHEEVVRLERILHDVTVSDAAEVTRVRHKLHALRWLHDVVVAMAAPTPSSVSTARDADIGAGNDAVSLAAGLPPRPFARVRRMVNRFAVLPTLR